MVNHSQLIICVKAIYFSLLSSTFLVPIVAAKWKMYEFFKLTTGSCSRTFVTKSTGRRRLKGMLTASLLTEVWLLGVRASFETVHRWGCPPFFWGPWTKCPRQHCQRLPRAQSPFLWELLLNWTYRVQPLPERHHTKSASLQFSHSYACPCTLLIRTTVLQLMYQPDHSSAPSPWLCSAITGLCLTPSTLTRTGPDPSLQVDVLAWPQPIPNPFPRALSVHPRAVSGPGYSNRARSWLPLFSSWWLNKSYHGLRCTLMLEQNKIKIYCIHDSHYAEANSQPWSPNVAICLVSC